MASRSAITAEGPAAPRVDSETEAAIADLEQQFAFFFQRIRVRWREAAQELHPDLTPTAYMILTALVWGEGPTTATHLSEILHLDKSALSRHIVALEEQGLIERHVDEHDARVRTLAASPAALAAVQAQRRSRDNELRRELGTWPREDLVTLARLLRRLTELA
jgi:DNA-binding MarR family transcriptional regulator